jgi:hypothetical protein
VRWWISPLTCGYLVSLHTRYAQLRHCGRPNRNVAVIASGYGLAGKPGAALDSPPEHAQWVRRHARPRQGRAEEAGAHHDGVLGHPNQRFALARWRAARSQPECCKAPRGRLAHETAAPRALRHLSEPSTTTEMCPNAPGLIVREGSEVSPRHSIWSRRSDDPLLLALLRAQSKRRWAMPTVRAADRRPARCRLRRSADLGASSPAPWPPSPRGAGAPWASRQQDLGGTACSRARERRGSVLGRWPRRRSTA